MNWTALAIVNLTFHFGASQTGQWPTSSTQARGDYGGHDYAVSFDMTLNNTDKWLLVPIDLETTATLSPVSDGPCGPALTKEIQQWSVAMEYQGADGIRVAYPPVPLEVMVYLVASPV